MYYEVFPTKIFRQNAHILTYSSETPLQPGQIVKIPFGKTTTIGIVYREVKQVDFKTKPILETLYDQPLPLHLLRAIPWLADYYATNAPSFANLMLPTGIEKKRRKNIDQPHANYKLPLIELNQHQKTALHKLKKIKANTKLLHGVTGSGKTNIYLQLTAEQLKQGKSTILLVPEIALTSQLIQIFTQTFGGNITLIHSRQTESERHQTWEKILCSDQPQIVIGPRSACFSPLQNLGLIIIDEAHEQTFYQENPPRYHTLRLASFIAKTLNIDCILGTATPLVTDYYLAEQLDAIASIDQKAKATAQDAKISIIDLTDRQNFSQNRYFSNQLIESIQKNLKNGHQTLIFHNRRGSAPLTICEKCGWQALCPTCFLPLTLHGDAYELLCHTCGHHSKVPSSCPSCGHAGVIHKGFGTKLLENELKKLFKTAKIIRFDADNTKDYTLDLLYQQVKDGEYDIIIGTQTVAKGLDLPLLATVGVVQADSGLNLPDYVAEERTFHLLTQVIGRVGRGHLNSAEAIIQTYNPSHPLIINSIRQNYTETYKYLLQKRHQGKFPPFCYLAKLSMTYKTETATIKNIQKIHHQLKAADIQVSSPTPSFHERTTNGFTWQVVLKSTSRQQLIKAIQKLPADHLHVTIDPPSLLA